MHPTSQNTPFMWSQSAEKALKEFKHCFTTTPVLTLPDPSQQVVVEVDASEAGVTFARSSCGGDTLPASPVILGLDAHWLSYVNIYGGL